MGPTGEVRSADGSPKRKLDRRTAAAFPATLCGSPEGLSLARFAALPNHKERLTHRFREVPRGLGQTHAADLAALPALAVLRFEGTLVPHRSLLQAGFEPRTIDREFRRRR